MTKRELVRRVARKAGCTNGVANEAIKALLDTIMDEVAAGDEITLRGFGTFRLRKLRGGTGRNKYTGEVIKYPEKIIPMFKPGSEFCDRVREEQE